MADVLLVGPEIEENLGLRYLASSLAGAGRRRRGPDPVDRLIGASHA